MSNEKEENQVDKSKNILAKPSLELLVSITLVLAGICEAYESLDKDLEAFSLKGHHGIIIFGLFHTFKVIVEMVESSKKLR
ncbi:MAG: hypothetical protein WAQ98_12705 [Blastocatellia bacterium]